MPKNISSNVGSTHSAVTSGIESVNTGVKTAAAQPGGVSGIRDSFQTTGQTDGVNLSVACNPAYVDSPANYLSSFAASGKHASALASNDQLIKSLSNENLDLFKETSELSKAVQSGLEQSSADKVAGGKKKDLQQEIEEKQKEIEELQKQLEDSKKTWEDITKFFGFDSGSSDNSRVPITRS
jgi:hypothetical protein